MRSSHARDTTEIRRRVPGGGGPDRSGARKPIAQVARDLAIHEGTLGSHWVAKERAKQGEQDGALSGDERARLRELEREVAELRMERDVLKRSAVLWVKEATR